MRYAYYVVALTAILAIGGAVHFSRPAIIEIHSGRTVNIDGEWIIQYEYALNGVPQIVFLSDDTALREYRVYLSLVGRFHIK